MNQRLYFVRFLGTRLALYMAAVIVAYLLAAVSATQSVVSSLAGMGVKLNFTERLSMTLNDITGMAPMLFPMIAFGLLIAFMTTALICRYLTRWKVPLYALAGAVALLCIHLALHYLFSITPVAIARTPGGLAVQALAGAAGGLTYVFLSRKIFVMTP
jgi:hypothetical protein